MLWNLPELEACFGFINSGHQQGSCDERLPITAKTITCLKNHALHCLNELLCHHTIQCDLWSQFFYYDKSQNGKRYPYVNVKIFWHLISKHFFRNSKWQKICNLRTGHFISYKSVMQFWLNFPHPNGKKGFQIFCYFEFVIIKEMASGLALKTRCHIRERRWDFVDTRFNHSWCKLDAMLSTVSFLNSSHEILRDHLWSW